MYLIHIVLLMLLFLGGIQESVFGAKSFDLMEMTLEELMEVEVTSASKKAQNFSRVPAAVYVITADEIRRSGATTLPELLRMVPGVEVARITSSSWAVSIRGFNGRFADKLLVLIDGRSVYTPAFSGVYWEDQDLLLEDIERIEVIRGPGGTLWGANAVNGIINIITKKAKDTAGMFSTVTYGTIERPVIGTRVGGKIGENLYFRIYTKYFSRRSFETQDGEDAQDDWQMWRGGFRVDSEPSVKNFFTLQGDIYTGEVGETMEMEGADFSKNDDHFGGNILFRWQHKFSEKSDFIFQFYYDHTHHKENYERINVQQGLQNLLYDPTLLSQLYQGNLDIHQVVSSLPKNQDSLVGNIDTYDFDFQHHFHLGRSQEIVYGFGARIIKDSFDSLDENYMVDPDERTVSILSAFLQDEIFLFPDKFSLILGCKIEHNDYTGMEYQPSVRAIFTPNEDHTLWAAISRAVRLPSRYERDVEVTKGFTVDRQNPTNIYLYKIMGGGKNFESEDLLAFELGYRGKFGDRLFVDTTLFCHLYDNLVVYQNEGVFNTETINNFYFYYISMTPVNGMEGKSYGLETALKVKPTNWWNIRLSYTLLCLDMDLKEGYYDVDSRSWVEGSSPKHQAMIWSSWDFSHHLYFDAQLFYVGKLSYELQRDYFEIPDYFNLNLRLAWRIGKNLELALVGQNLLEENHLEYISEIQQTKPTKIPRSVYLKMEVKF